MILRTGVYAGCHFQGAVQVLASHVVIKDSLIDGVLDAGSGSQQTGLYVEDTTINATGHGSYCDPTGCRTPPAVSFADFTLERVNVFGSGHGVQTNGHAVIRDSWIHGLCCNNQAHKDGLISNGGSYVTVYHNNIECAAGNYCSAALGLFGDFQPITHWLIRDNLFNTTGGYCAYGGSAPAKKYPTATYVEFLGNSFGEEYHSSCGRWGGVAYFNGRYPGNVWSGNVWAGTSRTVDP